MNEIPPWWFWMSALCLLMNTLLFLAIAVFLFKLGQTINELKPKVEQFSDRVDGVAQKVDGLTTTVHGLVKNVGEKATGVAGSANIMAQATSKVFERYAPVLGIVLTGLKVLGAVQEFRASRRREPELETED